MSQDTHYHITGVWADDSESGYIFKLSLWEVIEEAIDRVGHQSEFDNDGAHAYAEMEDYEQAWNLLRQSDRLDVARINLERVSRFHRMIENRETDDLPVAYSGTIEEAEDALKQSALFSLGLISGPTSYQVDLDPIEVWECVDPCEFPTFEEWEEAEEAEEMR